MGTRPANEKGDNRLHRSRCSTDTYFIDCERVKDKLDHGKIYTRKVKSIKK